MRGVRIQSFEHVPGANVVLRAKGNDAGAEKAWEMAIHATYGYASMATSGGEGTAMLREAGDDVGAEEAHESARDWAFAYASIETSGGEGTALGLERNEFWKTLDDGQ